MKNPERNFVKVAMLLVFFLLLFIAPGCEEEGEDVDEIIGNWEFFEEQKIIGSTILIKTPEEAQLYITMTFLEDASYSANVIIGEEDPDLQTGTWERKDNTTIVFTTLNDGSNNFIKENSNYYVTQMEADTTIKWMFNKQ